MTYISGCCLHILHGPTELVQSISHENDLVCLLAEDSGGKIACGVENGVAVYSPLQEGWETPTWQQSLFLPLPDDHDAVTCLSWGPEGELLVGSRHLSLYSTLPPSKPSSPTASPVGSGPVEERDALWSKPVTSPLQRALFSPSASLIATTAQFDRLVKIWRRLSFEEGLFDHCYLPHPTSVTSIQWRFDELDGTERRRASGIGGHNEEPEVLYTICADGKLRVWKTGDNHGMDILSLYTTVDLVSAIPSSPQLSAKSPTQAAYQTPVRYAFVVPAGSFTTAVATASSLQTSKKLSHSLEHLREVASKTPDVIVVLDHAGRMSAWGLENVACKRRSSTIVSRDAFHVCHTEDLDLRLAGHNAKFESWFDGIAFHIVCHSFAGEVQWWEGDVEAFLSTSTSTPRLERTAAWTGHTEAVVTIETSTDGNQLCTSTESGQPIAWQIDQNGAIQQQQVPTPNAESLLKAFREEQWQVKQRDVSSLLFGIKSTSLLATNEHFSAVVGSAGKKLTIFSLRDGYLEYQQLLSHPVNHLAWTTVPTGESLLAIASAHKVEIYAQENYTSAGHAWVKVKTISSGDIGNIGAMQWLTNNKLALAVGNGLLLCSPNAPVDGFDQKLRPRLKLSDDAKEIDLATMVTRLNAPLPVWNPRALEEMIFHGKQQTALEVVQTLYEKLKFWSEGDGLDPLLDIPYGDFLAPAKIDSLELEEHTVSGLTKLLEEKTLPSIGQGKQEKLRLLVGVISDVGKHRSSLDTDGLRYLFSWHLALQHWQEDHHPAEANGLTNGHSPTTVLYVTWRDILFAHHCTYEDILFNTISEHHDGKLSWREAKASGMAFWLSEKEALENLFTTIAQTSYRSSSPPDPVNASLWYLALHKKDLLAGLWRIATWNREQRTTLAFLKRDFSVPANRTAAAKNAYALMGKRRFEYAAAFFLLAEDPQSCVSVLAQQCGDIALAVAVARVYGGDRGPVLRKLLEDRLLPAARESGERWQMSWCYETLGRRQDALRSLIGPLEKSETPRDWTSDDPTALILYRQLRGNAGLGPEIEYEAVERSVRVLRRMGLHLLALDLVVNWRFSTPPAAMRSHELTVEETVEEKPAPSMLDGFSDTTNGTGETHSMLDSFSKPAQPKEPPSTLDTFAEPAPAIVDEKTEREKKAAELLAKMKAKKAAPNAEDAVSEKRKPTQFKEPDANSLLDSFGF